METEPIALGLAAVPGRDHRALRGRKTRVAMAAVIVTVGMAIVAAGSALVFLLGRAGITLASRVWTSPMQTSVAWAGSGSFVVAQLRDHDGRAEVCAWNPVDGARKTLVGYRMVAVNEIDPVVTVEKDPGYTLLDMQSASRAQGQALAKRYITLGTATDLLDDPAGTGFSTWNLQTGELSAPAVRGTWGTWPGPGGRRVSMDFDASRGAWPCALHFQSEGRPEVLASEPGAIGTVMPLGWVADGSAFAVVRCVSASRSTAAMNATSALTEVVTTVSLLSTADGSTLASTALHTSPHDAASWHVALDPPRGEVAVLTGSSIQAGRLLSLSSSEGVRPITLPPRAEEGTATVPIWLLGYDGQGVSFTTGYSANPIQTPKRTDQVGSPWAVWSTRDIAAVWSTWLTSRPPWAFDRRQGIAWINEVDFPERVGLLALLRDPVDGTQDVMWSPRPGVPAKRVMQGYYSLVF